jgi:heme oxygenase
VSRPLSARFVLREATTQWHARVDAVFSQADLVKRAGYGQFLRAQAAAFLPVECALDLGEIDQIIDDWPGRRRAHLICDDLAALDLAVPPLEPMPLLTGAAAMLGAAYVLEGSRLGGALLRTSVPAAFPQAFLSAGSTTAWRNFIAALDAALVTKRELEAASAAACDTFALFERSGHRWLQNRAEDFEVTGG